MLTRTDFDVLERELRERRLLPLIGSRALAVGGESIPSRFGSAVAGAHATARAHALAVEFSTRRIVGLLADRGIPALALKGPLLAAEAHEDVGLRETADIDVLVRCRELDAALRALLDEGYAPPSDPRGPDGLPHLHWGLVRRGLPRVELHWRVHWYERRFSADMLDRATAGSDGLMRPRREDLAASLLLFYARDGFHGVRLAADLAAWWDRHRSALPAGFLESYPRRYPELGPALSAAARVVEATTGVPAPSWLGRAVTRSPGVALGTRLADWTQQGDPDQLRANISLVGGLLGPAGAAWAFARRELVLPGAGRRETAAHAAKLAARYGWALWRIRRGRNWTALPRMPAGAGGAVSPGSHTGITGRGARRRASRSSGGS